MAETCQFRSQFNGFHREDVSLYIERTAKQHRRELEDLQAALTKAEQERDEALAKLAEAGLAEAEPAEPLPEDPAALELAAYRRAEAAERCANARVQKQAREMAQILDTLRTGCDARGAELDSVLTALRDGAGQLMALLDGAQTEFGSAADAAAALAGIDGDAQEEAV